MYALNIHNVTKVELKVTKLFNNFTARDLVVTSKDYDGKMTEHTIGLYGPEYTGLCPVIDTSVSHHYDDDDTTQTAA
jgi:hypothetical protein